MLFFLLDSMLSMTADGIRDRIPRILAAWIEGRVAGAGVIIAWRDSNLALVKLKSPCVICILSIRMSRGLYLFKIKIDNNLD